MQHVCVIVSVWGGGGRGGRGKGKDEGEGLVEDGVKMEMGENDSQKTGHAHALSFEEERTNDSLGGREQGAPSRKKIYKPKRHEVPEAQQASIWSGHL